MTVEDLSSICFTYASRKNVKIAVKRYDISTLKSSEELLLRGPLFEDEDVVNLRSQSSGITFASFVTTSTSGFLIIFSQRV